MSVDDDTENTGKKSYTEYLCMCYDTSITGYLTHLKGIVLDGLDRIFEEDLGGECVAVVDHRLIVWSIPTVQLHTAAALQQSPDTVTTSIRECC